MLSRRVASVVVVFALLAQPTMLRGAGMSASGSVGTASGTLQRQSSESVTGIASSASLGAQFGFIGAHAFFYDLGLDHAGGSDAHQGLFVSYGLGASLALETKKPGGRFSVMLRIPTSSTYVILADTRATVNSATYKHSSFTTLRGMMGAQLLAGYEFRLIGSGSAGHDNFYVGFSAGYVWQQFNTQAVKIRTNNEALAPDARSTGTVDYSLGVGCVNLTAAYDL